MGGDHMVSDLGPEGKVGNDTGKRKGKWREGTGSSEWWAWGRSGMAKKSGRQPEKDEEPLKGQKSIVESSLGYSEDYGLLGFELEARRPERRELL